jgi:hypothetical protein
MLSAFRDGMRERGYVEGQNLSIDVRWPQGTFEHDPSLWLSLLAAMLMSSSHGARLQRLRLAAQHQPYPLLW